jgi:hypothetical protein
MDAVVLVHAADLLSAGVAVGYVAFYWNCAMSAPTLRRALVPKCKLLLSPLQVTCVMGEPIVPPKWTKGKDGDSIPDTLVDQLHAQFLADMQALFNKYKAAAGYPDAVLEVV